AGEGDAGDELAVDAQDVLVEEGLVDVGVDGVAPARRLRHQVRETAGKDAPDLSPLEGVGIDPVVVGGEQAFVIAPVVPLDEGLAVARHVPGEADARGEGGGGEDLAAADLAAVEVRPHAGGDGQAG